MCDTSAVLQPKTLVVGRILGVFFYLSR